MSGNISFANACWLVLLSVANLSAADPQGYRQPLGVYAHVDIADVLQYAQQNIPNFSNLSPVQEHTALQGIYEGLLSDPAISGLTAGAHWDKIQLDSFLCVLVRTCPSGTADGLDWSYVDDVFVAANARHKFVQLIVIPGVDTPEWVLNQIETCDTMFLNIHDATGYAPRDCGKVTFTGFPEANKADGTVLPLPWNEIYIAYWHAFLERLIFRYEFNPAFVAIAVAGPTTASTEMVLPTSQNGSLVPTETKGVYMMADEAWQALISHSFPGVSSYQNSDQVFIDYWNQTIDWYDSAFNGITLVLSPDAGDNLPALGSGTLSSQLISYDCTLPADTQSCQAKAEILAHFVNLVGNNRKATQTGGMTASSSIKNGDIGLTSVRALTITTGPLTVPPPPFLGGAEFDKSVQAMSASDPDEGSVQEGCPTASCPTPLTVEYAAYNVFTVFFYGTQAYPFSIGLLDVTPVAVPSLMQYVEIDFQDVLYAQTTPCPATAVAAIGNQSLQDLLNDASFLLLKMANQPAVLPPHTCSTAP